MAVVFPSLRREDLQGRDFLTLGDFSAEAVQGLVEAAGFWKAKRGDPRGSRPLTGKGVALLFLKPSLRTRVSFEVAVSELGGHAVHLADATIGFGVREPVRDIANVLSRMVDAIVMRGHVHAEIEALAAAAAAPVINGLTIRYHPTQALADLLTLRERFGELPGLRLAYVGDGNNIAHSLMFAAAHTGLHLTLACPEGYEPDPAVMAAAVAASRATGGSVQVVRAPADAARDADAVYTDVWVSMGQDGQSEARERAFRGYVVDEALMSLAAPHAIFMHDLPAHRGLEVTPAVIDGPRSVAYDQAENRLHAAKAILAALVGPA